MKIKLRLSEFSTDLNATLILDLATLLGELKPLTEQDKQVVVKLYPEYLMGPKGNWVISIDQNNDINAQKILRSHLHPPRHTLTNQSKPSLPWWQVTSFL